MNCICERWHAYAVQSSRQRHDFLTPQHTDLASVFCHIRDYFARNSDVTSQRNGDALFSEKRCKTKESVIAHCASITSKIACNDLDRSHRADWTTAFVIRAACWLGRRDKTRLGPLHPTAACDTFATKPLRCIATPSSRHILAVRSR